MSEDLKKATEGIKKVIEEGWKSENPSEDPMVRLSEARRDIHEEIKGNKGFTPEERTALEAALDEVQFSVLKKLPPEYANIAYINDQGGAENYIKDLLLQKVALKLDSPEKMRVLLSHGMMIFFHNGGQELFTEPGMWADAKAAWSKWEWLQ